MTWNAPRQLRRSPCPTKHPRSTLVLEPSDWLSFRSQQPDVRAHSEVVILVNRLRSLVKTAAWKVSSPAVHHLDTRIDELAAEERSIHSALGRQDEKLEAIGNRIAALEELGQTMAFVRALHSRVGVLDALSARIGTLDELGRLLGGTNLPEQVTELDERINKLSVTLDEFIASADLESVLGMAAALQRFAETLSDRLARTLAELESLSASVNSTLRPEP